MKRKMTLLAMMVLFLGVAALAFAGNAAAVEPPGDARVRVAHLSPDAPNVDVWVDGAYAFQDVAFEEITDYATLPAGDHLVQVEPAGSAGGGPFVISATLNLAADTEYTVAALDELASLTPGVYVDDNSTPDYGMAHIRFLHGSPDAPAVDITLTDGTVLIANTAFGAASAYLPVPAGSYNLQVRVAGTSTVALDLPGITVDGRTTYTAYATGLATGGSPALNAIISEDAGIARVRVAHLSPDAPNVDVKVNGAIAVPNLAFEEVTGYLELPSNAYQVEVVPAGQPNPVVISAVLDLDPNTDYTVAALDVLSAIYPGVYVDDNAIPADGTGHLRFLHGSPDAPAVDITLTDGTVLIGNTAFGEASDYLPVPAGSYDLEVRVAGTSTVVLSLPGINVANQTVYTAYATGFATADGPAPLNAIITADAGLALVRVAHLSPDAPNVDIKVNGAVAVADLAFEQVTNYLALPAASYLVEVVPAGQPGPVVISAVLSPEVNTDYTVAAVNNLASIEALLLVDDNTIPADGNSHVRFVHASPDAPAVDITLPDGTVLFGDIEFKEVGAYLPVPFGSYDLEVRLAGTDTVVLNLDNVELRNQYVYTVFATGYATGGEPPLNAVLRIDARPDADPTDVSLTALTGGSNPTNTATLFVAALLGMLVLAGIPTMTVARRRTRMDS